MMELLCEMVAVLGYSSTQLAGSEPAGSRMHACFRYYATSPNVAGSILDEVNEFFQFT
jgi:hypothetical protein